MTNLTTLDVLELSKATGAPVTVHKSVPRSRRTPSFLREVVAPVVVFAGCTGAAMGGAWLVKLTWAGGVEFAGSLALCGAGVAGFVAAWYALPHYWELQFTEEVQRLEPKPATLSQRSRIMADTAPNTKAVSRCEWRTGWKAILARKLFDNAGQWKQDNSASPPRALFEHPLLVTGITRRWQDGDVQADLRALGWLDERDRWTDKAKSDLLDELFIGSPTIHPR